MGLIKAGIGAAGSVMADQWKEFFYCDAMGFDVLVKKSTEENNRPFLKYKGYRQYYL